MVLVPGGQCGVVVFDEITLVKQPVFINVLTKGTFFPAGGERVSVQIGTLPPRLILTGGDGYGRIKITPPKPGIINITATYGRETDRAALLVMKTTDAALLIEMDAALRSGMLSPDLQPDSLSTLQALSSKHQIVYLYGMAGKNRSRTWLESNHLPEGILLRNRGIHTIADLHGRHIKIKAFIGSAQTASEALPFVDEAFSFDQEDEPYYIRGWKEIQERLIPPNE